MSRIPARPALALLILFLATPLAGQRIDRPLRVFLDCNGFHCDQDFFIQEIPWAVFVRDRLDADVHVLGTRQQTGSGGSAYVFELRGRGVFDGQRIAVNATAGADATDSERRTALVEAVRVGLLPYSRSTPAPPAVQVTGTGSEDAAADPTTDPWDRWTFRLGVNGHVNGESQQQSYSGSGSASASRVTDGWKTIFGVRGSTNRSRYELDDTTTVRSSRESYGANLLAVRSLGGQWGAGVIVDWSRSSFANYDHSLVVGPAVEYNLFPYSESARRLLTVMYALGTRYNEYARETIFGALEEALLQQLLVVSYDVTQPWGSVDLSAQLDHYISRLGEGEPWADPQFSAQLGGGFNVRLIRGLSARTFGSIAMVRNQIQLPAGELSEEEILTEQRELATNYRYFASFGLSYRFGSIFSDIVNPRFEAFD